MYNKYSSMKKSQLKEAIKAEIKSVLSENRYDINDPNSPMGKLNDEYESSGLKGIVDEYGLDVVLMMLSSGEYGDRLNEAMSSSAIEKLLSQIEKEKNKPERMKSIIKSLTGLVNRGKYDQIEVFKRLVLNKFKDLNIKLNESVLPEGMSDEKIENHIQHLMRTGAKEEPLRKLAAIGKKEDGENIKEALSSEVVKSLDRFIKAMG